MFTTLKDYISEIVENRLVYKSSSKSKSSKSKSKSKSVSSATKKARAAQKAAQSARSSAIKSGKTGSAVSAAAKAASKAVMGKGSSKGSSSSTAGAKTNSEGKFSYTLNGETVYVSQSEVDKYGNIAKAGKAKMGLDSGTLDDTPEVTPENVNKAQEKALKEAYDIIDAALKKGDLTQAQADAYKKVVADWDPGKLVNVENVLEGYKKVASETIDPYWQQQLNFEVGVLQEAVRQQQVQQELEKEQIAAVSGENIRQAKAGLEQAGMTFTGKGIEQLGAGSAYSQQGSQIPTQTPFGGLFAEGTVNQANRLMTSSSLAKYQDALTGLGQKGEQALGSKGIAGLVPGYKPTTSNLEGSLTTQWNQAKGSAFLNEMDYWSSKNQLKNPIVNI